MNKIKYLLAIVLLTSLPNLTEAQIWREITTPPSGNYESMSINTIVNSSPKYLYPPLPNPSPQTAANLLEAEEAYSKRNSLRLEELINIEKTPQAKDLLHYWYIKRKYKNITKQEAERAINSAVSPMFKNRIRGLWVNIAGSLKDYQAVRLHYPLLEKPSRENKCNYAVATNIASKKTVEIALDSWNNNYRPPSACRNLHKLMISKKIVNDKKIVKRRRQALYRKLKSEFIGISSEIDLPNKFKVNSFFGKKSTFYKKTDDIITSWNKKAIDKNQEFLILATLKTIANKSKKGYEFYQKHQKLYNAQSKKIVCGYLLHSASINFSNKAYDYLQCAPKKINQVLFDKQIETVIRYFLRQKQWKTVIRLINNLSPDLKNNSTTWVYWKSIAALNVAKVKLTPTIANQYLGDIEIKTNRQKSVKLVIKNLDSIRKRHDIYGSLANEAFGDSSYIPKFTTESTAKEVDDIANEPCFVWASYLIKLGGSIRSLGTSEWIYCAKKLTTDRQRLAASKFALSKGIYDRTINTAILTEDEHDWRPRFITPYWNEVSKSAKEKGLIPEMIYGLVRQESRFIIDARSVVGARGLMQIMPKTGKWLAKKLEVTPFSTDMLNDTAINVHFGTAYMQMIFERFNHPVLVAASYNAGPSRAKRWLRGEDNINAIIYSESIPFTETRKYVKAVMWNATIYQKIGGKTDAKVSDWLKPIDTSNILSASDLL